VAITAAHVILFTPEAEAEREDLHPCSSCGAPTVGDLCAFCKLVERATR